MDVRMPRVDGLEATRKAKQEYPKIIVLVLDQGGRSTMKENRWVVTEEEIVVVGVDTHKDVHHVAAVLSETAEPC
jgi:CheY-like chemotaxis protein